MKNDLTNLLTKLKTARVGDTLFVYDETTEAAVETKIASIIEAGGPSRLHADGSREFYRDEVIVRTGREGSERYLWDRSGNKVKHERCRYVVAADGTMTREITKTVFKVF